MCSAERFVVRSLDQTLSEVRQLRDIHFHPGIGDRRPAGEAAGTAHRLAASCGGLRTPALALAGSPLPLTVREREMANLVAAGLTNRDIADRLTVSVRTVEGHLYRACTKCDCTDRDQLAGLIRSGQTR